MKNSFYNLYFSTPLCFRMGVIVLLLWLVWCIIGKYMIKLLSIIPLALKMLVLILHRIIELPICFLHRVIGSPFIRIDKRLSIGFGKIYDRVNTLLAFFYKNKKSYCGKAFIFCVIIIAVIIVSDCFNINSIKSIWSKPYLQFEDYIFKTVNK